MTTDRFPGFSPRTLDFLRDLRAHNERAWFEAHREEYEQCLLEPLKALVAELAGFMLTIDPDFVTIPAVDRTISRIRRDTRFSRDKSPYRDNAWIAFKRPSKDWKVAPCFFFELYSDWYRYGMGFYSAERETMERLREVIDRRPAEFRRAVAFYEGQKTFVLEGERYKRPLNPSLPEPLQQWYQRKNLYLVCNREANGRLFTHTLVDDLREGFALLAPLYHFLWRLKLQNVQQA